MVWLMISTTGWLTDDGDLSKRNMKREIWITAVRPVHIDVALPNWMGKSFSEQCYEIERDAKSKEKWDNDRCERLMSAAEE